MSFLDKLLEGVEVVWLPLEKFAEYEKVALKIGFEAVAAGPFVRSSYQAAKMMKG